MNFLINLEKIKKNFLKKENIFFFIFITLIFYLDRFTKQKILQKYNDDIFYVNDYINFDLIWNTGIGFGLLSTNSLLVYNSVTLLIGIVILFLAYILAISEKVDKLIYSIIVGGALGNFYDRVIFNAVPDFIDLHYGNFHWFTFNLADIFITIGILIFIIKGNFVKNKNKI
jgi:signal peptidase II